MNKLGLAVIVYVLMAVSLHACASYKATVAGERILASEFPKTASRAMFFQDRINSKDGAIRAEVLDEVGSFYMLPDSEFASFLKRMYQDPDKLVRGEAIRILYGMWVPQDPESLPIVFTGYHNDQVIDRKSQTMVRELIEQCSLGGTTAGYAAYVLGLLRAKEAIPALMNLRDDDSIFVQYTAGRALFDCGDRSSAIAIFDEISSRQLDLYASGNTNEDKGELGRFRKVDPWYAAVACRGLIEVGGIEKRKGLERLIELMGFLERSKDVNDQANLRSVRGILAWVTGNFFPNSKAASDWMTQDPSRMKDSEPIAPADADKPRR